MSLTVTALILPLVVLARLAGRLLREALLDKLTAVNDLVLLGRPRPRSQRLKGTALVAGASISGLLSARICSDHFESVLVVEPESLCNYDQAHANSDAGLARRARVPQYTALHAYQVLTFRALKILFPGFENRLLAWGGLILPADMRVHISGRPISPPSDLITSNNTLWVSRHLYESLLRSLVSTLCKNVSFMHGSVIGVVPGGKNTLKSVVIHTDEKTIVQDAALLVDCTGPAQAGQKWLEKSGYALLPPNASSRNTQKKHSLRTSHDPKFNGTTCQFQVPAAAMRCVAIPPPDDPRDAKRIGGGYAKLGCMYLYVPDPRRDFRNFLIERVEGDWLKVVCAGYNVPDRPASLSDIREFISSTNPAVPIPQYIYALLDVLEESGTLKAWHYIRVPPVSFVRYDAAHALPHNFAALGDALCGLNPIHGQGATAAMVGALTLNAALATTPGPTLPCGFSRKFFKRLVARLEGAWEAKKCDDYAFATTTPARGEGLSYGWFQRWYGAQLAEVASRDTEVAATLWHITNFLAPGTDVFSPVVVCKVLWNWMRSSRGGYLGRVIDSRR